MSGTEIKNGEAKRTMEDVNRDYNMECAKIGHRAYQKKVRETELKAIHEEDEASFAKMNDWAKEATAIQQELKAKEEAAKAAPAPLAEVPAPAPEVAPEAAV